MGAAHILNLEEDVSNSDAEVASTIQVVRPNSINMLWQLPQFFVITLGEVLFSVTGLEFSYSQAAPTMKSVLQVKRIEKVVKTLFIHSFICRLFG